MKQLVKAIVGSQAYGTSIPTSDIDYKGIYLQPNVELLTYRWLPLIEVGKDECYYELNRFMELVASANPTMLELLFSPEECIVDSSEEYGLLRSHAQSFITKKCRNSFAGYAIQQIQKAKGLNKKMNWEKARVDRKTVLDFLYCYDSYEGTKKLIDYDNIDFQIAGFTKLDHFHNAYLLYYRADWNLGGILSSDGTDVKVCVVPKEATPLCLVYFNKEAWQQHCKDWKSYETWINERNEQRYVDTQTHGQKIDGKNLMHCRRLLDMALEIATEGKFVVRRPNAKELLAIRKGEVNLEDIILKAEEDLAKIDELFLRADLPDDCGTQLIQNLIIKIRRL